MCFYFSLSAWLHRNESIFSRVLRGKRTRWYGKSVTVNRILCLHFTETKISWYAGSFSYQLPRDRAAKPQYYCRSYRQLVDTILRPLATGKRRDDQVSRRNDIIPCQHRETKTFPQLHGPRHALLEKCQLWGGTAMQFQQPSTQC